MPWIQRYRSSSELAVKALAAAIVALLCSSAYALGPLPNGQYAGRLICVSHNASYNSQADNLISVDDKTMVWGSGGLSVPGEDTFVYSEGKLYLVSSATIANELVKCEGVFSSRVEALRP
jgi:hypothetical protein